MKEFYTRPNGKRGVRTVSQEPTLTQQQFKDDCEVNIIMKRLLKTGQMPRFQTKTGVYADLTELPDYQQACQTVAKATQAFGELPSELRNKFKNNPELLIEFLDDKKNDDEAIKLGLRQKPPLVKKDETVEELKGLRSDIAKQNRKPKKGEED